MNVSTTPAAVSYRCAPWTRAQGADPIGSSLTCDTFVLIEVPPPWPRDVGKIPVFADLQRHNPRRTRLLAVRPADDPVRDEVGTVGDQPRAPGGSAVRVTIWRRTNSDRPAGTGPTAGTGNPESTGNFVGTDHVVRSDQVADAVVGLIEAPLADPGHRIAPAEVLLCGHGARDGCCGRLGTRLAMDVATIWPGLRVRRCSHTGGHRFAPTGFTLPDGRAWGFLDPVALDEIVRRTGPPPLAGHYRGNTALDTWGQVAERELFARFGWSWLDHRLTAARTEVAPGGRAATVELAWRGPSGPGRATATIDVVRDLPVLVCGEPPELAEKTAPELGVRSIDIVAG